MTEQEHISNKFETISLSTRLTYKWVTVTTAISGLVAALAGFVSLFVSTFPGIPTLITPRIIDTAITSSFLVFAFAGAGMIMLFRPPVALSEDISPPEAEAIERLLREPLHETTRKMRRNLLLASLIGFAMTLGGILPTKVDSLGIKFEDVDQLNITIITFFLILYFHLSFAVYFRNDYINYAVTAPFADVNVKGNILWRIRYEAAIPLLIGSLSLMFLFDQIIISPQPPVPVGVS